MTKAGEKTRMGNYSSKICQLMIVLVWRPKSGVAVLLSMSLQVKSTQDNVADKIMLSLEKLSILVSKQDLLWVVAIKLVTYQVEKCLVMHLRARGDGKCLGVAGVNFVIP